MINASANNDCAGINHFANEHNQVSPSAYDVTLYWMAGSPKGRRILTDNEDKFAQFFNAESVLVSAMTDAELIDHIDELQEIAFEAKARLTSAKTNQRDRTAKKRLGGEWTITPTDPSSVDAASEVINKVELRAKRMTKLDKTRAKLEALGLSDKEVDQMINTMMKQARKEPADLRNKGESANGGAITNKKPPASPGLVETNAKPLDISTLKFG